MTFDVKRTLLRQLLNRLVLAQDEDRKPIKKVDLCLEGFGTEEALETLEVFHMIRVDDTTDAITVTIEGRMFAGLVSGDLPDLGPGKLAKIKGSISETELAAMYIEGKMGGIEKVIKEDPGQRDTLLLFGRILKTTADEFRQGLHLPAVTIEGRVIPYNDDNETGVLHEANLHMFFADVHERNVRAGWWSELETGEPKKRSPGELMILMVTELAEAYDAWLTGEADDKLPDHPGLGVEMGDALIRIADFCGALAAGRIIRPDPANNPGDQMFRRIVDIAAEYEAIRKTPKAVGDPETADFLPPMLVAQMVDDKLHFNAAREDHRVENRLKEDGKRT